MGEKYLVLSELNIEGQFLGFVGEQPSKYKYLELGTPSGNLQIKLPKHLRLALGLSLVPGEQITICGISKLNPRTSKFKFDVSQVNTIGVCPIEHLAPLHKAKILVCQKSGCLKRGGEGLLSNLEKSLCDRGLLDKVVIEHTDCQKCCSSAPNCTLTLGKKQYKQVSLEKIISLLENYLFDQGCSD